MPLAFIPLIFNFVTGFAVWYSEINVKVKVILTIALVVKYACYFYSALIVDNKIAKRMGLIVCALLNVGMIAIAVILSAWIVLINCSIIFALLIVWSHAVALDFIRKGGKKD